MESNNLILGRIPGSGDGLRKTYEESIFIQVNNELMSSFFSEGVLCRFYYSSRKKQLKTQAAIEAILKSDENAVLDFKEVVVLGVVQFQRFSDYYKSSVPYFVVEIIEKNVLHNHLVEERMILEDMRNNGKSLK